MSNRPTSRTLEQLAAENHGLRAQLDEAQETLRAVHNGEVDAFIVSGTGGEQLFTLKGADHSYRMLIEEMSEGALTLTADGVIAYANRRFAKMLETPLEKVIGSTIHTWIAPGSEPILQSLLRRGVDEERREQLVLAAGDGTMVPISLSVSNLLISGMPVSYCLVATDLTEQKRSDAVAASEALARELLAASDQSRLALLSAIEDQKQAEQSLRRRLAELDALHNVSGALRTAQTRDEALPILLGETLAALETDAGIIWLYDPDSDELRTAAARGWFQSLAVPPMKLDEGVAGAVFASGQTHVSAEFARDPLLRQPASGVIPAGWAGVCVPIRTGEITIGALLACVPPGRSLTTQQVELLESLAEMGGAALHRMSLHEETVRQLDRLQALHRVDQAISANTDLGMTLNVLLEHAATQLGVDATDVLLLNPHTLTLEHAAGRGFRTSAPQRAHIRLGEGLAGRAALERRPVQADDPTQIQRSPQLAALLAFESLVAYHAVPLIAKGQVIGVLEVFGRAPLSAGPDWVGLLETLAGQAAIAIENAQLFEGMQRSNLDLALAYDATLEGWSHALDLRDKETEGHTQRVTEITVRLARAMGIADDELVHVRRGALLHDIGKMGVPDGILLKPGPLTDEEWVIMRRHPQLAYDLLSPINYLRRALDIPICHHERWDGAGYPRGLAGEQIPLVARLFAVVDVWDALRSDRPYREAWTEEKVLEHLRSSAGTHFDPRVVDVFLDLVKEV